MSGTSGLANLNSLKCECDILHASLGELKTIIRKDRRGLLKEVLSVWAALREGHFALATSKLEDLQAVLAKRSFCDIPAPQPHGTGNLLQQRVLSPASDSTPPACARGCGYSTPRS